MYRNSSPVKFAWQAKWPVWLLWIFTWFLMGFAHGVPNEFAFNSIPSRFYSRDLTTGSRGLGEICLSRDVMPDGSICNPAYLALVRESSLLLHFFAGNGYAALSTVQRFVLQPLSKEFLQELFRGQRDTSLEADAGLLFTTRYFSAAFSPYRVQYVSEVHNPNFPVVAVHAAIERTLVFSGGVPLESVSDALKPFSLGLRLRYFERNYVHGSFSLFQAMAEEPRTLLSPKSQQGIMVEPSLGWVERDWAWHPSGSVSVTSLGFVWPEDPLHPEISDLSVGVGIEPPVGFGVWRIGVDVGQVIHGGDFLSRVKVGTSYQLGVSEFMVGLNARAVSTGLNFSFKLVQVGVVYEFVRSDFGGVIPGSKIATELSIRL